MMLWTLTTAPVTDVTIGQVVTCIGDERVCWDVRGCVTILGCYDKSIKGCEEYDIHTHLPCSASGVSSSHKMGSEDQLSICALTPAFKASSQNPGVGPLTVDRVSRYQGIREGGRE